MNAAVANRAVARPEDVYAEVATVADAVRIGRDCAQEMIATAALMAFGPRARSSDLEASIHLFTVETVSELATAEVPRAIEQKKDDHK